MRKSTFLLAVLALLTAGGADAAPRGTGTEVAHTPWLGLRLEQDGKPVRLIRRDLRTIKVRLAPRPFRIRFPKRRADVAYQLCAWTDQSIFRQLRPRPSDSDPNAGGEHPCFLPGTGMADTEAGSGMLMLDPGGNNYLIDLRLGPDPGHPAVYYSSLWTRQGARFQLRGLRAISTSSLSTTPTGTACSAMASMISWFCAFPDKAVQRQLPFGLSLSKPSPCPCPGR